MGNFFLCSCQVNVLGFFWKMAPVTAIMGVIYSWFNSMDNYLLHASGHSPADKIENQINFDLIHARLYLAESDDERDEKSSAVNTFNISCGDGGSSSSLSYISVSVLATSNVVHC